MEEMFFTRLKTCGLKLSLEIKRMQVKLLCRLLMNENENIQKILAPTKLKEYSQKRMYGSPGNIIK